MAWRLRTHRCVQGACACVQGAYACLQGACVCVPGAYVCVKGAYMCAKGMCACVKGAYVCVKGACACGKGAWACVCVSKGVPLPEYLRGALQREPQEDVRMHKLCNREPCMQGSLLIRGRPRGIPTGSVGAVRVRAVQKRGSLLNKAHCSPGGSWKKSPQTTSCRPPAGCGEPRMSRIWRRGAEGRGACWPNFSKAAVHVTLLAAQWSAFRRS